MQARSSDGPAGMVFDAVFNTPDVGAAAPAPAPAAAAAAAVVVVEPPCEPAVEPPNKEVRLMSSPHRIGQMRNLMQPELPKVDIEPSVAAAAAEPVKEEPAAAPQTPIPPNVTLVQVSQVYLFGRRMY